VSRLLTPTPPNLFRHAHALLTVVATLALITVGGLVTSHGAGMAVPDWPNTYGYNMFFFPVSQWVGGIFYEHTHRLLGSLVGFLTLVLALWLYGRVARPWLRWGGAALLAGGVLWTALAAGRKDWALLVAGTGAFGLAASCLWPKGEPSPPLLRTLGLLALIGVIVQGVLGGMRVVLMQDVIGVVHGTLAQLFLFLVAVLALLTSPWWIRSSAHWTLAAARPVAFRGLILATALLILGQLALGATMRHRHAGLAVPDFPLAHGQWWPATDATSIARYNQERVEVRAVHPIAAADIQLHMVHRLVAVAVLGLLVAAAIRTRQALGPRHLLARATLAWAALGGLQLILGACTVWTNKSADIATAHVAVGSLLLAGGGLLCVLAYRPAGRRLLHPTGTVPRQVENTPALRTTPPQPAA
jgi:heme a synthase